MYSFEEKEKIIKMLKAGINIDRISQEQNIPVSILTEWQEELEIRQRIKTLIQQNKLKEAEDMIELLTGPNNETIRISFRIMILRAEGSINEEKAEANRQKEKELLKEQLRINPKDIIAMSGLIKIARIEGDIETEKFWIQEQLNVNPKDKIATSAMIRMSRIEKNKSAEKYWLQRQRELNKDEYNPIVIADSIRIAREEGDIETEKSLLEQMLQRDPNNIVAISSSIRIAREEGNIAREKELLARRSLLDPDNTKAMSSRVRIAIQENDIDLERKLLERILELEPDNERAKASLRYIRTAYQGSKESIEVELEDIEHSIASPVGRARSLIYENQDIVQAAEQIKELLEGEGSLERELVLAELYFNAGLVDRAKKELRKYKGTLQTPEDIKIVAEAIKLLESNKTKRHNWEGLWFDISKKEQIAGSGEKDKSEYHQDEEGR